MPTYEYACKSCGRHVEVVQSIRDAPLTTCSVCGGPLRKVFTPIGISFKGKGFYRTDSRSDGRRGHRDSGSAAAAKDGGASSKESTSAESSSGAKEASPSGAKEASSGSSGGKEGAAASSSAVS